MKDKGTKPKIVNIVATGRFPKPLDIAQLYQELDVEERDYEPEQYPALLVKIGKDKKHVTLYRNGKFIITGVSTKKELMKTYDLIYKKLQDVGAF